MIDQTTNPATTAVAAAGWKALGGLAATGALGAGLASIVVMCIMTPRSRSEWVVGLISTVIGSISGGAFLIMHYDLHHWMESPIGLVSVLGMVFACGLPAWACVRWVFTFIDRRKDHDIKQVFDEVTGRYKDPKAP